LPGRAERNRKYPAAHDFLGPGFVDPPGERLVRTGAYDYRGLAPQAKRNTAKGLPANGKLHSCPFIPAGERNTSPTRPESRGAFEKGKFKTKTSVH